MKRPLLLPLALCAALGTAMVGNMGIVRAQAPSLNEALADLRYAHYLLTHASPGESNVTGTENQAAGQTQQAIVDLRNALRAGDQLDASPPDQNLGRDSRLHAALRYLEAARTDLSRNNVSSSGAAWESRAVNEVNAAITTTNSALAVTTSDNKTARCKALEDARDRLYNARTAFQQAIDNGANWPDIKTYQEHTRETAESLAGVMQKVCPGY